MPVARRHRLNLQAREKTAVLADKNETIRALIITTGIAIGTRQVAMERITSLINQSDRRGRGDDTSILSMYYMLDA